MCGRYVLKTTGVDLQKALGLDEIPTLEARYNIAPMQAAPIITSSDRHRLTVARWGLLPHWTKDTRVAAKLINARAETLESKPLFRELLPRRRCVVPCDGFYEWKRDRHLHTPHYIHLATSRVLTMAGLWSSWRSPEGLEVVTFTVITTTANRTVAALHDRMPVFLDREARAAWLSEATEQPRLPALLVPWAGAPLEAYQVSPLVNGVATDSPACIEPARVVQLELF